MQVGSLSPELRHKRRYERLCRGVRLRNSRRSTRQVFCSWLLFSDWSEKLQSVYKEALKLEADHRCTRGTIREVAEIEFFLHCYTSAPSNFQNYLCIYKLYSTLVNVIASHFWRGCLHWDHIWAEVDYRATSPIRSSDLRGANKTNSVSQRRQERVIYNTSRADTWYKTMLRWKQRNSTVLQDRLLKWPSLCDLNCSLSCATTATDRPCLLRPKHWPLLGWERDYNSLAEAMSIRAKALAR